MYVSARSDYTLRAMLAVASAGRAPERTGGGELVKASTLAGRQGIPLSFLHGILPAAAAGYHGVATGLRDVWFAMDDAIAVVVDRTTLTDLLADEAMPRTGGPARPEDIRPRRPEIDTGSPCVTAPGSGHFTSSVIPQSHTYSCAVSR